MANVNLFRGGTPAFKPMFCAGEYAEWTPPFDSYHKEDTPPYDSHAEAAQGQGYLNLVFPLIPRLGDTMGHHWMQTALKGLEKVNDIIWLTWVPLRSFVVAQHIEVSRVDPLLEGVYFKPVAKRVAWDFTTNAYKDTTNTDYAAAVAASGVTEFPFGKFGASDARWGFIDLTLPKVSTATTLTGSPVSAASSTSSVSASAPCTFGHNLVKTDANGNPTGGLDEYYGAVVLGYQISKGAADKIKLIWRSNIAVYMSAKLLAFECPSQIG
ncbi:MAG: hypothetical protein HDQ88_09525 [Clostridia bacterium]|nr:hypothetical protein [Clostridia bacterium]